LLGSTGSRSLGLLRGGGGSRGLLVGDIGERSSLSSAASSATATGTASAATATASATAAAVGTLLVASLGSNLLLVVFRLPGELNADLALEDVFAGEVRDGLVCLIGRLQVDEGITDRAVGARVDGDGSGLAMGLSAAYSPRSVFTYTS
jgi:hypothetical protein